MRKNRAYWKALADSGLDANVIADMKAVEDRRDWMFWLQDVDRKLNRTLTPHNWLVRGRRAFLEGETVKQFVTTINSEYSTETEN